MAVPAGLKVTTALLLKVELSVVEALLPATKVMLALMVWFELTVIGLLAVTRPPPAATRPRPSVGLSRSLIVRAPVLTR